MRFRFDQFELDTDLYQLRADDRAVHVEPLVFDLLSFLVQRPGQVVSRDAIIEHVWKGRFVSDATVSSCIKSARKALGDSGESQAYIRTVRGRGFQFAGTVTSDEEHPAVQVTSPTAVSPPAIGEGAIQVQSQPKIAVLPLFPLSPDPKLGLLGDAVAQEVILELSRLRWLFVIARGSSFQFRGQEIDLVRAASILGASYFLTGTILEQSGRFVVSVELSRSADNVVIWADRFDRAPAELMHMRSTLAGEIVGALESRIHQSEVLQTSNLATEHLGAWSAYHRGLWHMYRFTKRDNGIAADLFSHAVKLDQRFARGYAGLSFTHFQNAFLGFTGDVAEEKRMARMLADRSIAIDPLDPFVNLTMGRAEWINGDLERGLPWMERSISLSPNYAFAIYNSALVGTILGDGEENEKRVTKAMSLSPIDPLHYAMLATRALTHVVRAEFEAAVEWVDRAARSPNAHIQIFTMAAFVHELTGQSCRAADYVVRVKRTNPTYRRSDFLMSFPFRDEKTRGQVDAALARLGL